MTTGTTIGEISSASTSGLNRELCPLRQAERGQRAEHRRQDGRGDADDQAVLQRDACQRAELKKSSYQRSDKPGSG